MSHERSVEQYSNTVRGLLGRRRFGKAKELRQYVKDADRTVDAEIAKDDETAMDMGATLIVVLGTPAIVAVATKIDILRVGPRPMDGPQ